MPALVRSSAPRGARFYQDGDRILFMNVLDGSTRYGPMLATTAEKEAHPEAWDRFVTDQKDEPPGFQPLVTFSGDEPEDARDERAARVRRRNAAEA